MCVLVFVHMCASARGGQETPSGLIPQVLVSLSSTGKVSPSSHGPDVRTSQGKTIALLLGKSASSAAATINCYC